MAYLIKGAHVVDPQVGLDDVCDVLVEDKLIVEVAENIEAGEDTEVIDGTDIDGMISGGWDLSLYTCTYGGEARFTVRCDRAGSQG